jgi:hypothetical protein
MLSNVRTALAEATGCSWSAEEVGPAEQELDMSATPVHLPILLVHRALSCSLGKFGSGESSDDPSRTRKSAFDRSRNMRTCPRGASQEPAGYSRLFL